MTREDVVAELIVIRTEFSRRIDALLVKLATKKPACGAVSAVGEALDRTPARTRDRQPRKDGE